MNVLVTGSTGFLGRHLIPLMVKDNYNVLELTRSIEKSESLFADTTKKHLLTDNHDELVAAIKEFQPEAVIHLASFLTSGDSYTDMKKLVESNILYLTSLLDALKESGVKFFINTGTFAEYFHGDGKMEPAYLYAATKSASRYFVDYYANAYNFTYTTVTPYTIYGGNDSQKKIIDYIADSLDAETPVQMSPGGQVLDFIHVNDVTGFYLTLLKNYKEVPNKSVFPLGTGTGSTIKQLAALIEQIKGQKCNINWGGRPYRPTDVMYAVADVSELSKISGWQPNIDLKKGLEMHFQTK